MCERFVASTFVSCTVTLVPFPTFLDLVHYFVGAKYILDTISPCDIGVHTNVSAPAGRVAFHRDSVIVSGRQADRHRAGSDRTVTVDLQ